MANQIFDRDTLLDLTVNVIPLFIIGFFLVGFTLYPAFGREPLGLALQYGLLLVPFVSLAVLTYYSGKAIAGAERRSKVFLPGTATVEGAKTLEEYEEEVEAAEAAAVEGGDPELTDGSNE